MAPKIGNVVHPWYKGTHEWKINNIAELSKHIEYRDDEQGEVKYDPKIIQLENKTGCTVLWFPYWMSTTKTNNKLKWGQRPSILEESTLLELMKDAIRKKMLSDDFLKKLKCEIEK